jgi:hypothetical protein
MHEVRTIPGLLDGQRMNVPNIHTDVSARVSRTVPGSGKSRRTVRAGSPTGVLHQAVMTIELAFGLAVASAGCAPRLGEPKLEALDGSPHQVGPPARPIAGQLDPVPTVEQTRECDRSL